MHVMMLLGVCTFLALVGTGVAACNLPPSIWCSSKEIAQECQVELNCEKYVWSKRLDAPKVKVALYYESLCPGCRMMIKDQLYPAWKTLGDSIMDVELVPYGNTREEKVGTKWQYTCQHGPEECYGDLIEACAMHHLANISIYFPFIHCIESSTSIPRQSAPGCAQQEGISYVPIKTCADGPEGNSLEHVLAEKTGALQPPHRYVPWITLNGKHTDEIQREATTDMKKLVCDTYQGPKPPACTQEKPMRSCDQHRRLPSINNLL